MIGSRLSIVKLQMSMAESQHVVCKRFDSLIYFDWSINTTIKNQAAVSSSNKKALAACLESPHNKRRPHKKFIHTNDMKPLRIENKTYLATFIYLILSCSPLLAFVCHFKAKTVGPATNKTATPIKH